MEIEPVDVGVTWPQRHRRHFFRRGELFALRWQALDLDAGVLVVQEAVYEGSFGTPKTVAGLRSLPLADAAVALLRAWRQRAKRTEPTDLVFSTVSGKSISPNNVLRRWVSPACAELGLPSASWLTFRRTYASWAHEKGVPVKVLAELMGHARVDTSLNVYTQVIEGAKRVAAQQVGGELFTTVHDLEGARARTHREDWLLGLDSTTFPRSEATRDVNSTSAGSPTSRSEVGSPYWTIFDPG